MQLGRRRVRRALTQDDEAVGALAATLDQMGAMLERTEGQAGRLTRMVDDLLDVSRIQSGHLEIHPDACDLSEIVRDSVDEQRAAWTGRTIADEEPDGVVIVRADADRIRQVVTNYVTNALKYSAPECPVAVTLTVRDREAWVRVRDEGPGLTVEQQQAAWDRYQRVQGVDVQDNTGRSGGGLGLGLYISRTIIEAQGGRVGVESRLGEGATFWFALPLA